MVDLIVVDTPVQHQVTVQESFEMDIIVLQTPETMQVQVQ
jgi:hypothetical protein